MSPDIREWTAPGPGGVSVVVVAGEGALERVERLLPGARRMRPGRLSLEALRAQVDGSRGELGQDPGTPGELLDEALVYAASAEHVELHLHGSPPVVRRILEELGASAVEPDSKARPSLEELAQEGLGSAPSEPCARMLLDQAEGALRRELEGLLELGPEEGAEAESRLGLLLENGRVARWLVQPPRVVLAGPSNAGKSTLFNELVGSDRALVDPREGTTRDALRAHAKVGEWTLELLDTAGERELVLEELDPGSLEVERTGQRFGRQLRAQADWVAWLDPDPAAPHPRMLERNGPLVWTRFTSRADELAPEVARQAPRPLSTHASGVRARATFLEALLEALALPERAWEPGRPVPFVSEQCQALSVARQALVTGEPVVLRETLEGLLTA